MGTKRRKRPATPRWLEFAFNPLVLGLLIYTWKEQLSWELIAVISGAAFFYFLFVMLRVCNARNKDGSWCGNDAHGLLGGCRSFRRHGIQARWRFVPIQWRPASVQKHFESKAEQRRRAWAGGRKTVRTKMSATPVAAVAATPAEPIMADGWDMLGILEVLFAAGSFFIALVQLAIA